MATVANSQIGAASLAYDNASNFQGPNDVLLGRPLPKSLKEDPFWSTCVPLQTSGNLFPLGAVVRMRDRAGLFPIIFGGNDPAHTLKMMAAQLRSATRTIHLVDLHVDPAVCLSTRIPLSSFAGKDTQSDREAALLFAHACPNKGEPAIFHGNGTLVYTVVTTAAIAPWYDPHLIGSMPQFLNVFAFQFLHFARWNTRLHELLPASIRNRMFSRTVRIWCTGLCQHILARSFWGGRRRARPNGRRCLGLEGLCRFCSVDQKRTR